MRNIPQNVQRGGQGRSDAEGVGNILHLLGMVTCANAIWKRDWLLHDVPTVLPVCRGISKSCVEVGESHECNGVSREAALQMCQYQSSHKKYHGDAEMRTTTQKPYLRRGMKKTEAGEG